MPDARPQRRDGPERPCLAFIEEILLPTGSKTDEYGAVRRTPALLRLSRRLRNAASGGKGLMPQRHNNMVVSMIPDPDPKTGYLPPRASTKVDGARLPTGLQATAIAND